MKVTPKKYFGQHFLKDKNIARKIVSYIENTNCTVIEIGPGTGVLTGFLSEQKNIDLFLVEIDKESVAHLKQHFPGITNRIIEKDFLKLDFSGFKNNDITIIGNFPYNISSQILFKILENREKVSLTIGMFQREVALRIAAQPGSKTYGILSVLCQAFYNVDYLFTVNESVFNPPPKIKSAVIRLIRNDIKLLDCDESLFFRTVKTAFNQRRKTLKNSLKSMLSCTENLPPVFEKRPEQLPVNGFVELTNWIQNSS